MTCRRCGREIESDSTFCRYCGAPAELPYAPRRLTRLPSRGKLGGVCAGLAAYLDTDPTVVRLAWAILSVVPGVIIGGLIAYLVAWILLPVEEPTAAAVPVRRLRRSSTDRKIAGVCSGLAEYLGVDVMLVRMAAVILAIFPGAVFCGIAVYVLAWLIMPSDLAARLEPSPSVV